MNYLLLIFSIMFIFFQENTYQNNIDKLEVNYQKELEKKDRKIKSLKMERDKKLQEKIEYTNVILDDMQDDINLKFNQNEELNQIILKRNIDILKELKCKR